MKIMRKIFSSKGILKAFSISVCLLSTSCGFNNIKSYKVKTTTGSNILFKEENVFCNYTKVAPRAMSFGISLGPSNPNEKPKRDQRVTAAKCIATGELTDILGNRRIYSDEEICKKTSNSIPCLAGEFFNKYSKDLLDE
tara:strand:- start:91 stop:507 length:417 start_codon:yes stop_codon:yes gene_type:complete